MEAERPPLPPFITVEAAGQKVRLAEDAWNTRDPERVALAYTPDSRWRNRAEFLEGRAAIVAFLTANGTASSTIDSSRSCGGSAKTVWRFASPMNGMTTAATGSVPMATSCGSLMSAA